MQQFSFARAHVVIVKPSWEVSYNVHSMCRMKLVLVYLVRVCDLQVPLIVSKYKNKITGM
jgi:hypothetical protein